MLEATTKQQIKTKTYKFKNVELSEQLSKTIFETNGILLINFVIDRIKIYDTNVLYFYFLVFNNKIHYVIENKNCKIVEEGKFKNDIVKTDYLLTIKTRQNQLSTIY